MSSYIIVSLIESNIQPLFPFLYSFHLFLQKLNATLANSYGTWYWGWCFTFQLFFSFVLRSNPCSLF
ncbi:hypothetical protein LZ30DRAFT_728559 [Colletotrichum cereale]|nr:hypothetical protein LZ30DRAFT_728559 [Colletotrichum cereale]